MEIWKTVDAFPNYKVSNKGRLKSIKTGKILSPSPTRSGYINTLLYKEGKPINVKVHRLVAEAFIPNTNNLPVVNHIDRNKANNEVTNLEWCTQQHNAEHASAKTYTFISPDGEEVVVFNLNNFCKVNKLNQAAMLKSLQTGWKHKGWKRIK